MSTLGSLGGRPRRSAANGILGGFGAVPTQWSADSRVKALQSALNSQMYGVGCSTTLTTDGLIGPKTCGALAWSKATGSPPSAYSAYASDFDAGCRPISPKAPACPTQVVPSPAPSAISPAPAAMPSAAPPVVPRVPTVYPSTPVVVPGGTVPQVAPTLPSAPVGGGGPKMATIALIGGAVVAVGLGVLLLTGKKKSEKKAA